MIRIFATVSLVLGLIPTFAMNHGETAASRIDSVHPIYDRLALPHCNENPAQGCSYEVSGSRSCPRPKSSADIVMLPMQKHTILFHATDILEKENQLSRFQGLLDALMKPESHEIPNPCQPWRFNKNRATVRKCPVEGVNIYTTPKMMNDIYLHFTSTMKKNDKKTFKRVTVELCSSVFKPTMDNPVSGLAKVYWQDEQNRKSVLVLKCVETVGNIQKLQSQLQQVQVQPRKSEYKQLANMIFAVAITGGCVVYYSSNTVQALVHDFQDSLGEMLGHFINQLIYPFAFYYYS